MKTFKLKNEPKIATGFTVPEHYFNDFSAKVLSQLSQENVKVIPLFPKRATWLWAVAAILMAGLVMPIYNSFSTKSQEVDSTTLENHLTYQTDINPYELISELEEEDINKLQPKVPLKHKTIEDILTANPDLEGLIAE